LAAKIKCLLDDEELRKKMGVRGIQLYQEKFTLEKFEQNLQLTLKKIFEKQPS